MVLKYYDGSYEKVTMDICKSVFTFVGIWIV